MLHRHKASVEEGRVEGGRIDDGNKRGRNGARHGRRMEPERSRVTI